MEGGFLGFDIPFLLKSSNNFMPLRFIRLSRVVSRERYQHLEEVNFFMLDSS